MRAVLLLSALVVLGVWGCGEVEDVGAGGENVVACEAVDLEPNDQEATAQRLGSRDDCDDNAGLQGGVLAGDGDVDWFYYEGWDESYCRVNPRLTLPLSAPGMRACMFFACDEGTAEVSCPDGAAAADSPSGLPGCCGASLDKVGLECVGSSWDAADVMIRIDQPGGASHVCASYDIAFNF